MSRFLSRFDYANTLAVAVLLGCCATPAWVQAQPIQCELNGESVNLNNGNSTAGKTGLVRCRNANGDLQREEEVKNGKFMGKRVYYTRDGRKEQMVNERGNLDGLVREFYPDGTLKEEGSYSNGERIGVVKRYYPGGQLERLTFAPSGSGPGYERGATLEYREDGRLRGLQCGTRSLMAEDRAPCGFTGGASKVELFGGPSTNNRVIARVSFLDGTLVGREEFDEHNMPTQSFTFKDGIETRREYFPDGKPRREKAYKREGTKRSGDGTEREWASNGQMVAERRYTEGYETGASLWYMNGNMKEKRSTEGRGREAMVRSETYYDSGKLHEREVLRNGRPVGKQEVWDEAGILREEATFDERGTLTARRSFDEQGKLKASDEFYEDGSRKLK